MADCKVCGEEFEPSGRSNGTCFWCNQKQEFAAFAKECGLDRFPDPTGERYIYSAENYHCTGKKSEEMDFMDLLWNALAELKSRPDLKLEI